MASEAFRAVIGTLFLAAAAFGISGWIERILPSSFSRLDRVACALLGGLGLLGILLFIVGQFAYTPVIISVLLAVPAVAGVGTIGRLLRMAPASLLRKGNVPLIPTVVIGLILGLTAVAGLNEITGDWGSDAIAYHLLGPKLWLREGVVRAVPDNCLTAFPPIAEVLYGALIAVGGLRAPGFFAVLNLFALFLVVGSLSTRLGLDDRGAWWVVAVVATMPAVYMGGHTTFVDAFYAGFVLAAVSIVLDAHNVRHQVAWGLFCGLAMGTKYTGVIAGLVLLPCAIWQMVKSQHLPWSAAVRRGCMAFAAAALIASPFYLRNWIVLGSPIYPPPPILAEVFEVKYLSAETIHGIYSVILKRGEGLGRGIGPYLLLPFNLTYHTANFHGAGGIGLIPLALGPIGLVALRRDNSARVLAIIALLLTTLWFVTQQESRFLIHVYVISAIFGIIGWRYAVAMGRRMSLLLSGAVIACSLLYGSYMIVGARLDDLHAVFSPSFAERQRSRRIPFVESIEYLNGAPTVRKVLVLDPSVMTYYFDKSYLKPFGQWGEQVLPDSPDVPHVLAQLHRLDISHLLDVRSQYLDFRVDEHTPDLTLVFERANQRVYRVNR